MAETNNDPLMQEIEEELRQEQMQKLWKTYGNYIIGVALAVVVSVASYQGWQAYDKTVRSEDTAKFIGAADLIARDDPAAAATVLSTLTDDSIAGVKLLASLRAAELKAKSGDHAGAATGYLAVADDTSFPQHYRDLATLLGASQLIESGAENAGQALSRLEQLTSANNQWRHSARELSAVAAIEMGNNEKAREFLQAAAIDAQAPAGVKSRAEEILRAIGF